VTFFIHFIDNVAGLESDGFESDVVLASEVGQTVVLKSVYVVSISSESSTGRAALTKAIPTIEPLI
jgi:hypothetical protein